MQSFLRNGLLVALLALVVSASQESLKPKLQNFKSFNPSSFKGAISIESAIATLAALIVAWAFITDKLRVPVKIAKLKKDLGYLWHLDEVFYMFLFKFTTSLPQVPKDIDEDLAYCYKKLTQTSRSFSAVILELHPDLRDAVCIFYLVLRGLDSIEDDMKPPVEEKVEHLHNFHKHLRDTEWNTTAIDKVYGTNDNERDLLANFNRVAKSFLQLEPAYCNVIEDICKRMGYGMAEFLTKEVDTIEDYEQYCHYVAGLVGHGLSGLFAASGLEDPKIDEMKDLSNSMGLFLQKTNISRDYLEDVSEEPPRIFYPKEIWSKYSDDIADFKDWSKNKEALYLINHMVTDALKHAESSIDYMKLIKEPSVFKFCAIPQVMAIATLHVCYNNIDVFRWEVKIRKGEAVKLILGCTDFKNVCRLFRIYVQKLRRKVPQNDPTSALLMKRLDSIEAKLLEEISDV